MPVLITLISKLGISEATNALKLGAPLVLVGPINTYLALVVLAFVPPRATAKVPAVILLAFKFGIRSALKVSLVILFADKLGIRSALKVPSVILPAFNSGISEATRLRQVGLAADPEAGPANTFAAVTKPVYGATY